MPIFRSTRDICGRNRTTFTETGSPDRNEANTGRILPKTGEACPNLKQLRYSSAEVARTRPILTDVGGLVADLVFFHKQSTLSKFWLVASMLASVNMAPQRHRRAVAPRLCRVALRCRRALWLVPRPLNSSVLELVSLVSFPHPPAQALCAWAPELGLAVRRPPASPIWGARRPAHPRSRPSRASAFPQFGPHLGVPRFQ